MSSILKALKKLEDEKTGYSPDSLKIDSDILKNSAPPRSTSPVTVALVLLLMFGGGAAAAYFMMKETKSPSATAHTQTAEVAKTSQPSAVPQAPKTVPAQLKPAVVPVQKKLPVAALRQQQKKVSNRNAAAHAVSGKPDKSGSRRSNDKLPEASTAAQNEPSAPVAAPSIRVNGIAFQNTGADSMAIINGIPVSSGSVVEGAIVEEIRKDSVVFRRNGEKFEVKQGQANR